MFRFLVTNGCSFTRGQELAKPETQAWPAVLAGLLGVPFINLACDGSSNRRIVRTTVASLAQACEEARVRHDEVLVMILWTYTLRHEYYALPQASRFFGRKRATAGGWQDINPWQLKAGHRSSRAFYDNLWSDEGQVANLYLDWLLLDSYLRKERYCSRYAFATREGITETAGQFLEQLDPGSTLGGLPPAPKTSFTELVSHRKCGAGGHPLADSHELFAHTLFEWLTVKSPASPTTDGLR